MKFSKVITAIIILVISIGWIYQTILNDAVRSTTLKYILADAMLGHKNINLMLGSSTIQGLNQQQFLTCGAWLNRGIGNSTIANLSHYVSITPLAITPSKILVYAGDNDIKIGLGTKETIKAYQRLINSLLDKYPDSEVHVIAIKPSPSRHLYWNDFDVVNKALNIYLKQFSRTYFHPHPIGNKGFDHESFVADGIHLTEQGYYVFTLGINKICTIK